MPIEEMFFIRGIDVKPPRWKTHSVMISANSTACQVSLCGGVGYVPGAAVEGTKTSLSLLAWGAHLFKYLFL